MKKIIIVTASVGVAVAMHAEPFNSGKAGQMPSAGGGARVPGGVTPAKPATPPAASKPASPSAAKPNYSTAVMQAAVRSHVTSFYAKEKLSGPVTLESATLVTGWSNRYSTKGEINVGTKLQPVRRFEVISEVDESGNVHVLDLLKRS